ncbi:hypothetical protein D3C77_226860 [compost metagenome]
MFTLRGLWVSGHDPRRRHFKGVQGAGLEFKFAGRHVLGLQVVHQPFPGAVRLRLRLGIAPEIDQCQLVGFQQKRATFIEQLLDGMQINIGMTGHRGVDVDAQEV